MKRFMLKWLWAYRKIREWECAAPQALFRAFLYAWRGHSGYFFSHRGKRKSCIYEEASS